MKVAIVLSGGGSKGSYQIGVWKALKKLKIKYDIVTGTSVGALNGALMVQKTYLKALWMWKNIDNDKIYDNEITDDVKNNKLKLINKYLKNIVSTNGMSVNNLSLMIEKNIDESKILKSTIDFGLITVKFPSLKEHIVIKKDIQKGELSNFLMASASCYPFFQKKEIKKETYIDGGYYDNLPINLAIDLGANEIIAVDLETIGYKKKVINKSVPITIIKPSHELGNFVDFSKEQSIKNIKLGYNDTMKKYNIFIGEYFTFDKKSFMRNFTKYNELFLNNLKKIKTNNLTMLKNKLNKKIDNFNDKDFLKMIENIGKLLNFNYLKIYKMSSYNKQILKKLNNKNKVTNKLNKVYDMIVNNQINDLNVIFNQNDLLMAMYVYLIKN